MAQAKIEAISDIIIMIVITIAYYFIMKKVIFPLWDCKNCSDPDEVENRQIASASLGTIVSILFFIMWIIFLFSISDILAAFLNPEYWVLQHIISLLKQ